MAYTVNSIDMPVQNKCEEPTNRSECVASIARIIGSQVEEAIQVLSSIENIMTGKTIERQKEGPSCIYGDLELTRERLTVLLNELYYFSALIGACPDGCKSSM